MGELSVRVVGKPPTDAMNGFYVGNRPPLKPSPLLKLPVGSIEPRGWLLRQLRLQADGFFGHLTEISRFLRKEGNAWLSPDGEGHSGWEEVPYWLRGFGDLGYVLGDERIIEEARTWIEAALSSQREDGYFGPRSNLTLIDGKPDLWPNMLMLNVLQSYYEFSGDGRVLELMERYFRWELSVPEEVVRRGWPEDDHPFKPESVPVELRALGRRIPEWREDELGLVGLLPQSPVRTGEPVEEIRLIPMGAARLRISAFPRVE